MLYPTLEALRSSLDPEDQIWDHDRHGKLLRIHVKGVNYVISSAGLDGC